MQVTRLTDKLGYTNKNSYTIQGELEAEVDEALRNAFGRGATKAALPKGQEAVDKLQSNGRWIACNCQVRVSRHPMLFPVAHTHIKREPDTTAGQDDRTVPHHEDCDFIRDVEDQRRVVRSHRTRPIAGVPSRFRLLPAFARDTDRVQRANTVRASHSNARSGLARLLCDLMTRAGVQIVRSDQGQLQAGVRQWDLDSQRAAILESAAQMELAQGVPLSDWLALNVGDLQGLIDRVTVEPDNWPKSRPHGIFIEAFKDIKNGDLIKFRPDAEPVHIEGAISIFGESVSTRRGPYLVACLIAKPTEASNAATLVRAYAHPCVNWNRWTLVDSKLERDTLTQILRCRDWVQEKFNIDLTIDKPLHDCGPEVTDDSDGREVCIPDFLVRPTFQAVPALGVSIVNELIVAETMGINTATYRKRKERMRPYFELIEQTEGGKNPVVEYDPSVQGDFSQKFWSDLRFAITDARASRG